MVPFDMPAAAPASVTVRVLLFASYADSLGFDALDLTLPAPAVMSSIIEHLRGLPGGRRLPPKPLCARNLEHAGPDDAVAHGDEVAILPPLAGG
jgi:molybdopterin converting factor small subunit